MQPMSRRSILALLEVSAALALGLAADASRADSEKKGTGRRDHDDVLGARERGGVLPLGEVLTIVRARIDGEIIETEFEIKHGRPVYEFKYVDRQGRVRELYVDARSGTVLKDKPD